MGLNLSLTIPGFSNVDFSGALARFKNAFKADAQIDNLPGYKHTNNHENVFEATKLNLWRREFVADLLDAELKPADIQTLAEDYDFIQRMHGSARRLTGELYFLHPREVTLILLKEFHSRSLDVLRTALYHDLLEETSVFGSLYYDESGKVRCEKRNELIKRVGADVTEYIETLSKPPYLQGYTKEEMQKIYNEALSTRPKSEEEIAVVASVKCADILHNHRTPYTNEPGTVAKRRIEVDNYLHSFSSSKSLGAWGTTVMHEISSPVNVLNI